MLVTNQAQTELENGKVFGFKLATGEEIIGKVTAVKDATVSVSKPHFLTQTPEGVAFAPALTMMSETVDPVITRSNLVMFFEPDAQFITAYDAAMSDIIVPDSKILT